MSSAIITHAFLELIYCYGMLYTRFRVPAPPAGQMDVRKQVPTAPQSQYFGHCATRGHPVADARASSADTNSE